MVPAVLVRPYSAPTRAAWLTPRARTRRPQNNDITLSLLARGKREGFSALVVTVDTMAIGWRPLDLDAGFLPFAHGLGIQIALSDPVFVAKHCPHLARGEVVPDPGPEAFPYDARRQDALIAAGDEKATEMVRLARAWGGEAVNGTFRSWEDVRFLRKSWEGPLVLKGIMSPEVSASFYEGRVHANLYV